MIEKIKLKNILSHEKSIIDLCCGINVFSGETDSGKSSIIRALIWALQNKPSGKGLRRFETKKSAVQLFFSNGSTIERGCSASSNYYKLNKTELKAFGRNVPDEIQTGVTDLHIQTQHDNIFLLNKGGREVAKQLNKIVDLEAGDNACLKIKRIITTAENEQKGMAILLEGKIENIFEIKEILSKIKSPISKLKSTEEELSVLQENQETLDSLIYDLNDVEKRINYYLPITKINADKAIETVAYNFVRLKAINVDKARVNTLLHRFESNKTNSNRIKKKLKLIRAEEIEVRPEICPVCKQGIQ